ncbi:MAG: putative zinc finger/helix-turn-helix YgiT family protein [Cocleimonas sp.]|jgi:putative zinc finger/helix-turn-helix YgiT family protein
MYCPVCESDEITKTYEIVDLSHLGLDNVCLNNVPVVNCEDCGHVSHTIPKQKLILKELTLALCKVERSLVGKEFAFLRSQLNLTGIKLSKILGTTNVSISRWEKGEHDIHPLADRGLRALVLGKFNENKHLELIMENITNDAQGTISIDACMFTSSDGYTFKTDYLINENDNVWTLTECA